MNQSQLPALSIREYFAAAALTGLTTTLRDYMNGLPEVNEINVEAVHWLLAKTAVDIADKTLKELDKTK